jgi:diguanylate cyclase (GGDEF)-like protein
MIRNLLTYLRARIAAARHARTGDTAFWKQHLWRLLAWPIGALIMLGLAWLILFQQLHAERKQVELRTLQDARTLAGGYAERVLRAVDTVEQTARYVKYDWESRQGDVHLGFSDEHGLFVDGTRMLVSVVDADGNVLTSTAPTTLSPAAAAYILPRVEHGFPVNFFVDEVPIDGRGGPRQRLLFAWELSDRDGKFAAAAVIAVDPAYFTMGDAEAVFRQDGLLALVGDDGRTRALRSEGAAGTVRQPGFVHAPSLRLSAGSMLVGDGAWFGDGRPRFVGWQHIDRRGVNAVVGLDYQAALAPWYAMRSAWINSALLGTVTVVLFTLLAMSNSLRLARRDHELRVIRDTYRMATEASNEGFYMLHPEWDDDGAVKDFEIIDCNRRAAELVAREPRELIGKKVTELYEGEVLETRMQSLRRAMDTGYNEVTLGRPQENFPAKWVTLKMFRYGDNLAVSARDVTEDRVHEEELLRRSNEDPLTRLPNRYWVEGHLRDAIARAERENKMFALLFIDLDGFKAINDTWGHAAGDELLCTAAHRLKEAVRPHDCVTRFGGDEFVIVLDNITDPFDAAQASERIQRAFRRSIRLSYGEYVVGASIGISLFPTDGKEPRALLQNADVAMYSAKTNDRGSYRFFDGKFHDQLKARLERIRELRHALAHDQFVMYYEPRVDLADGSITSLEALVRWVHPTRGVVSPAEFVPLVEETGLVLKLGDLVIDKVCAQLARWAKNGDKLVPVSINVSPRQFNDTDVAQTLRRALEMHGVDPSLIEVELTESSVMNETASVVSAIQAIRQTGIKVLLDDFGTGYSSLSQLYKLSFDGLKIDRAFIVQLGKTEGGIVIVRAIVTMARALAMRVVAEGVETMEQVDMLRALDCDEIQGYLISKAMPPAESQPVARNFVMMEA